VYVTPSSLPPFTPATRLTAAGVTGMAPTSGMSTYRIAYRTTRFDGSGGAGTARVYLPTAPRSAPLPIVVATHGTTGLSDLCAPSRWDTVSDYIVLPWVGHGYAVVAPDYAGLGNEGTQGYGDNADTGYSTLDAARALRKLVASGALSSKILVEGHSQGGGSALSAQALAKSYGADGDVVGVIPFAPGWTTKVSVDGFRAPLVPTSYGGGLPAAVGAMFVDAYFANYVGPTHEGDGFASGVRSQVVGELASQCIFQLVTSIPQTAPTVGALFDATLMTTAVACFDATPGCAEPGKSYLAFNQKNVLTADASGAKVLMVLGMQDTAVAPPAARCVVDKLQKDGVTPQVCTDAQAQHLDVVQRNAAFAVQWTDAIFDGTTPPPCSADPLPTCP
jgi:pimeloyl-ACP methyl ester carboxylesterase